MIPRYGPHGFRWARVGTIPTWIYLAENNATFVVKQKRAVSGNLVADMRSVESRAIHRRLPSDRSALEAPTHSFYGTSVRSVLRVSDNDEVAEHIGA